MKIENNIIGFKYILFISATMIFVLLPLLVVASFGKVYVLNLEYSYGKISVDNVYVKPGNISTEIEQTGDYKYELVSFKDEILYTSRFDIETSFMVPPPLGSRGPSQKVELKELSFTLVVPYFENGKTINIYDPENNKVLSIDVGYFTDVCGDS